MDNIKILVVDDDINIAELLRLYLEKEGFSVVTAENGAKAIINTPNEIVPFVKEIIND